MDINIHSCVTKSSGKDGVEGLIAANGGPTLEQDLQQACMGMMVRSIYFWPHSMARILLTSDMVFKHNCTERVHQIYFTIKGVQIV